MKKAIFVVLALMVMIMSACATQHRVGQTREASKSQRFNTSRVGAQFNSVR